VENFVQKVDVLRDDVERFEKRLTKLPTKSKNKK
jgi:ubiquinone biosynthesis protein UbiJ